MRQLIVSEDLLAQVRNTDKPFGALKCTALGVVGLARRVAGSKGDSLPEQIYDELVLEDQAVAEGIDEKLTFVLAEPPLDTGPIILKPEFPLGLQRAQNEGPPIEQPYLKTILEKEDQLLVVGSATSELLYAQSWPAIGSRVWRRGTVTNTPLQPTDDGIDPNLKGIRVGIVGLGSIGGRLASLLARAGVTEFVFLDPERLERKNLRRHICDSRFVGSFKVDAVADHLTHSGFDVSTTRFALSIPRSDTPEVRRAIETCDVLVCCADSSAAQHHVNYLATQLKVPCVVASIKLLPEALGEVIVTKTGQPGCLNCWRLQLEDRGLMMRGDGNDPQDYPGPTEATPVGMPSYHLDQVATVACDMASRAMVGTEPLVWLTPLQIKVSGFEDLEVQATELSAIEPLAECLVCGTQ
jgi:ThiF family protein